MSAAFNFRILKHLRPENRKATEDKQSKNNTPTCRGRLSELDSPISYYQVKLTCQSMVRRRAYYESSVLVLHFFADGLFRAVYRLPARARRELAASEPVADF